jgi:toxin ParE1/3/4
LSEFVLSIEASADLNEIWEYIAHDDIEAADGWIEKLFGAFESLARVPGMGHTRNDLTGHAVLFWPVGAYLVIYRVTPERIEIVAVTQGARDIPSFLGGRVP